MKDKELQLKKICNIYEQLKPSFSAIAVMTEYMTESEVEYVIKSYSNDWDPSADHVYYVYKAIIMLQSNIGTVESYQTEDGRVFETIEQAEEHHLNEVYNNDLNQWYKKYDMPRSTAETFDYYISLKENETEVCARRLYRILKRRFENG